MNKKTKTIISILMLLFGIFFASNIYVIGNDLAAVDMHKDLYAKASTVMIQGKVIDCFFVGILYVIGAIGLLRNKNKFAVYALIAPVLFILFYIIEIISWSSVYPVVWIYFGITSGINMLFFWFAAMIFKTR
jgi:hypothetical protein